jgi:Fe2+ transport system protein B
MSSNMQLFSDFQADLAAVVSDVGRLKATQPNLDRFAGQIGAHLLSFEAEVTRNFTDKFAGSFFRATEAMTARVVNLEERQVKLEDLLDDSITKYDEMLAGHRQEIAKLHKAHVGGIKKLLDDNGEKLKEQQGTVAHLVEIMQRYDAQFVTLVNACQDLQRSSLQLVTKADAAVERFDQISTGTLNEIATEAQLSIKRLHDDAQQHIVTTRKRFNKVMGGFDDKLSQHPALMLVMLVTIIGFFFGLAGNVGGRLIVKQNAQEMINESVAKAQETINQRVDEKIDTLKEISEKMNRMVDDAQYWDALTANMNYDQKMAYIQLAQEQAKRQGRTLRVSNDNRQEKPKR